MSVTIRWRLESEDGVAFKSGMSSSLSKLQEAIGSTVRLEHIPLLEAMTIASGDAFFSDVADKVREVGAINVWGEW